MKVIYGTGKTRKYFKNPVVTIGVFDGLHMGHQKLIRAAVRKAKRINGTAIVMTFAPHPVQVLHPNKYLPFIVSLAQRVELFERLGVHACIVIRFTKRFSRLTASQFVKKYLADYLRPKAVFVGEDFQFGKDRQGTLDYFKKEGARYGMEVHTVSSVKVGKRKIGSSRIRRLITEGRLSAIKRHLGRDLSIAGKVMKGDGRGRTLGFPTANISPENEIILPTGVYAVHVLIGGKHSKGMANIGHRPSFKKNNSDINIETHIFDFSKNIYGKEITVEFIKKIRNEKMFQSAARMIAQLKCDEVRSRAILKSL